MNAPLLQIGRAARAGDIEHGVSHDKWRGLRPTNVQVYLENKCHLRCQHCYESSESHPHDQHLSLDEYDALFGELAALGGLLLTFTGGEIFLRKDALDVVALARKHRFAVTLFTSGTLIDEARADRIKELKVSEVHISVYSHDASLHDAFTRSPGSHARSVRALDLLRARGVRTVLKANVLRFNIDALDELAAFAKSLGADIQLDPSVRTRMDGDRAPLEYAVSPDEIMRRLLVRPEIAPAFRKHQPEQLCSGDRSVLDGDDVMCGAARDTISIGADGSVSACGYFPVAAAAWQPGSLRDIWLGSAHLDDVREMTFGKMRDCPSCDVKTTCNPCMAYGLVEHGHLGACNSASRHGAEAVRGLAELSARANTKLSRGRMLAIVGERDVAPVAPLQTRPMLNTEP